MTLARRNGIYIEMELAKRIGMPRAPDEHIELSGKGGLGLFVPRSFYEDICFIFENYDY